MVVSGAWADRESDCGHGRACTGDRVDVRAYLIFINDLLQITKSDN